MSNSTEDCLCKKQPGDLHIQLSANSGMSNGDLLLLSARRGALDNMRRCHAGVRSPVPERPGKQEERSRRWVPPPLVPGDRVGFPVA